MPFFAIHAEVLAAHGGGSGMRSRELSKSAVAVSQVSMMEVDLITDPIEIDVAHLYDLCSNHSFAMGTSE
jgi:prophage maintenance system killer protein